MKEGLREERLSGILEYGFLRSMRELVSPHPKPEGSCFADRAPLRDKPGLVELDEEEPVPP
jgi:hypothetical protein